MPNAWFGVADAKGVSFAPQPKGEELVEAILAAIDAGMERQRQPGYPGHAIKAHVGDQRPRNYLGGSRLGVECERALGYEHRKAPVDPGRGFNAKTFRIFDLGHVIEELAIEWWRAGGFDLEVIDANTGRQARFEVFFGDEKISGGRDGKIHSGPVGRFPCLWECKGLNNKNWTKVRSEGVEKAKPVYFTQCQVYMDAFDLTEHPCMFFYFNKETADVGLELIKYNEDHVRSAVEKGIRIIEAKDPGQLPRLGKEAGDFRCKFCDWHDRCWRLGQFKPQPKAQPTWRQSGSGGKRPMWI